MVRRTHSSGESQFIINNLCTQRVNIMNHAKHSNHPFKFQHQRSASDEFAIRLARNLGRLGVVFSNNNKGDTKGRPFAVSNINHTTATITNFPAGQLKWINSGQVDHILFAIHNEGGEAYKISKGAIVTQMKRLDPNARLLTLYPILDTL